MNAKILIPLIAAVCAAAIAHAQNPVATDSLTRQLQEVVVTARQPATRLVGSTLVTTIPGSNLADLGTALDVLAQLPMIRVQDHSVSVIGKSDIEIYIDGRPLRNEEELQKLRSSNLKTVELNMAPGAAYASSTGAVLRICTRRNFMEGLSVTDRLGLQRRRRWSVTDYLGLSYRTGRWEFFANGSVSRNSTLAKGATVNTLTYGGKATEVGSSQHNSYLATVGTVKAGVNYAADSYSLGAYYRYNPECGEFNNSGTEWLDSNQPIIRDIDKRTRAHSHHASAYFETRFGGDCLLHFDGDYRQSLARNGVDTFYPESAAPDVSSTDERKSTLWAGKLYVEFPLFGGSLNAGTQDSYTRTRLRYRMLSPQVGQYIPSAHTDARQTSVALFASWSRTLGRLSLTAGARYEFVDYNFLTDGRRDEDVSRRHHMLTPDLSLGYTFSDESQISLSYKLSTIRPPYSQLTGSLSYVGLHEIEGGNPALRDERMHRLQLFGMWRDFMLQADFTRSVDSYAYVKQLYPANSMQLIMRPVNINVSALSLYLVWSRPVRRWTPNVTAGLYSQRLSLGGTDHHNPIFSYYFDNTFALPHGWTATANISGCTRGDMHTNRFGSTWFTMDASVSKRFLDKSLTVKLEATDIFNTANNDWTMNTFGIFVDKRQSYDRRGVTLSATYIFQPHKSRYRGAAASEAEMNRL